MFANVKDRSLNEKMTISDPAIGGHRNLGKFSITQASDFGDGVSKIATSNAPGDIFVGERYITVAEAKPMAYQTFDIPMYRATSGVFVRVYGLTEHGPTTGGWLGPFTAVVEAELDQIDFYLNSTKSNPLSSIYYRSLTHSPAPLKDDILEFPDATGRRYVNVLTPNPNTATRVKLKLYNGGNRFYTLDDIGGSPILAYSDKMCVIEIYFKNIPGQGGQVDVKVSHAQWYEEPPIDKEV